jgi:transcriptional/translational regulatory protein YebC/TACO1
VRVGRPRGAERRHRLDADAVRAARGRDGGEGAQLVEALEDLDDVQNVWANFDISDEVLERVG